MPTDKQIDNTIVKNLPLFNKPGVTSIRPGLRIRDGWITKEPAIVVSVRKKIKNLPASEMLPAQVGGIPVDVRPVNHIEALRATDPEAFAQQMADVPAGNEPLDMQTSNPPLERNVSGQLIAPKVDAAMNAVAGRRPPVARPTYVKLPPATFAPITDNFTVTCFASPDAGWPTLEGFLGKVQRTLTVGMFEFTAPYIVDKVVGQMSAGRTLNLVLDDPRYDHEHRDQTNDQTQLDLKALAGTFNFSWAAEGEDPHTSLRLFPSAYHIKVAVSDGASFFLSSGNFNRTNQPQIDLVGAPTPAAITVSGQSDRDWHVIVENAALSKVFEDLILRDVAQAQPAQRAAPPPNLNAPTNTQGRPSPKFFPPATFTANMTIQPALTPDNFGDVILPLIAGAKTSFWMQTQYINPGKSVLTQMALPAAQRSILMRLVDALSTLMSKPGVDVRVIVDDRVTSTAIEQMASQTKLNPDVIRRQQRVHNKGMIIDGSVVVIGSQNWSTEGVDTNRDASLVITSADIAAYWEQVFLNDWNNLTEAHEPPP